MPSEQIDTVWVGEYMLARKSSILRYSKEGTVRIIKYENSIISTISPFLSTTPSRFRRSLVQQVPPTLKTKLMASTSDKRLTVYHGPSMPSRLRVYRRVSPVDFPKSQFDSESFRFILFCIQYSGFNYFRVNKLD